MEEIKQHDTCRMREGWCRDCESTEYKDGCLVSPTVNELLEQLKQLKERNLELADELVQANQKLISYSGEVEQLKEEKKELVEALREVSDQSTVYRSFSKETETKIKSLLSKVKQ